MSRPYFGWRWQIITATLSAVALNGGALILAGTLLHTASLVV